MSWKKGLGCVLVVAVMLAGVARLEAQEPTAPGGGKVLLRVRLQQGKTYKLRNTQTQNISQTIQGQKHEMTQEMGLGYAMEVQKVAEDGTMSIKLTYDWARFKQAAPPPVGSTDYDSSRDGEAVPGAAKPFAALLKQGFTMDLSPRGEVSNLRGLDKLLDGVIGSLDLPPGATKTQLEKQFRDQFGEEAMKEIVAQMVTVFPQDAIGIGESWSQKATVKKPFPMTFDNTWTLKARANGIATLDRRAKIAAGDDAEPMKIGTMSIRPSLSGEMTGTLEVIEASGWAKSSKLTLELSGKMKMEGAPGMSEPMEWPITAKGTVTIEAP